MTANLGWARATGLTLNGHPIDPVAADSARTVAAIRARVARLQALVALWEPGSPPPVQTHNAPRYRK